MSAEKRTRLLIFIVAYHAETTIPDVLRRIPALEEYDVEILIIDDGSADGTFELSERIRRSGNTRHPLTVLTNPVNQGYGGNQKLGYRYALVGGFDCVALLHGDGQYAPEMLPDLVGPIARGEADVVFGSRMLVPRDALKGGMPLYKFAGNRILTWYQNRVLRCRLSEFHTGYRVYSTAALRRIPFEINSNVFHFDTEIIIQCLRAGCRIKEVAIPTHYGDEVCRVPGMKYAWDVVATSTVARLQEYALVYRRMFDVDPAGSHRRYASRLEFDSALTRTRDRIAAGSRVLLVDAGPEDLAKALVERGCQVTRLPESVPEGGEFPPGRFDYIVLLGAIEHSPAPEQLLERLRGALQPNLEATVIVSCANVGFFVTRLMLLLGQFNYNRKGILDLGHRRLFTRRSLRRLLQESGFNPLWLEGVPAPVPYVVKSPWWSRWLMRCQRGLIAVLPGLFSYQVLAAARPLPTVETLLRGAERNSRERAAEMVSV